MLRLREFWSGYRSDEPIALFRQGFNVGGIRGFIPQGEPDLADGVVEPLVELNESRLTPNLISQLLASDNLASVLNQNPKHTQRLRLDFDRAAVAKEILGGGIQLEWPKPQAAASVTRHGSSPP
jgi:hypothetical protein